MHGEIVRIQTLLYSYNLIVQMKLLNPVAKKLHSDSLAVLN
jgi:hypothetical protein